MKQELVYTYILYGKYVVYETWGGTEIEKNKDDLRGPAENGKVGGHLVYIGKL